MQAANEVTCQPQKLGPQPPMTAVVESPISTILMALNFAGAGSAVWACTARGESASALARIRAFKRMEHSKEGWATPGKGPASP